VGPSVWARLHKLDRVRPLPSGGAILLIEDGRSAAQMQRVPSLSTLIAIARVMNARRALDAKFEGKGEVRYAISTTMPSFLSEAIARAGGSIASSDGQTVLIPAQPSSVSALIDVAFAELAHNARLNIGVADLPAALKKTEEHRRARPLDKDAEPEKYWTAVLELAALAGELSRSKGGRWIDTRDLPLPFALKFSDGGIAHPTVVAQKLVEGKAEDPVVAKAQPPGEPPAPTDEERPEEEPATAPPAPVEPATEDPARSEPANATPAPDQRPTDESAKAAAAPGSEASAIEAPATEVAATAEPEKA
jgi:hypothetical protein